MILHALTHHLNGDNNILSKISLVFNNHNDNFQNLKSRSYLKLQQSFYCKSSLDKKELHAFNMPYLRRDIPAAKVHSRK